MSWQTNSAVYLKPGISGISGASLVPKTSQYSTSILVTKLLNWVSLSSLPGISVTQKKLIPGIGDNYRWSTSVVAQTERLEIKSGDEFWGKIKYIDQENEQKYLPRRVPPSLLIFRYSSAIVPSQNGVFYRGLTQKIFWGETQNILVPLDHLLGIDTFQWSLWTMTKKDCFCRCCCCHCHFLCLCFCPDIGQPTEGEPFQIISQCSTGYSKFPPSFKYFSATALFLSCTRTYDYPIEPLTCKA